jgi:hypothetical protein
MPTQMPSMDAELYRMRAEAITLRTRLAAARLHLEAALANKWRHRPPAEAPWEVWQWEHWCPAERVEAALAALKEG